jgi:phage terminase small subunit
MRLSLNQERFVAEFRVDLNATQAASRAGYSAITAASQGERLLRNADIAAAVEDGHTRQLAKAELSAGRVLTVCPPANRLEVHRGCA